MRILIIGGTKFLGRFITESALAGGHEVTHFHRGLTNPALFPQVEKIWGDRVADVEKLRGRRWQAVIDTCGYTSQQVRASGEMLAGAVEHYTFISSISVYAGLSRPGMDEAAPLERMPAGQEEDARDLSTYGARKALCEQTLQQLLPGRLLVVRPGMIVGPHDPTGRFPYWVRRVARGGEVLAPGDPQRPVQLIDARDLAGWIVRMLEARQAGVFNATGPDYPLTMGAMLADCRTVSQSDARFTWVSERFLLDQGVTPWSELPFWLPGEEAQGMFTVSIDKALQAGLFFRPLEATIEDTLAWDRGQEAAERTAASALGEVGLAPEREAALLAAWHAQA